MIKTNKFNHRLDDFAYEKYLVCKAPDKDEVKVVFCAGSLIYNGMITTDGVYVWISTGTGLMGEQHWSWDNWHPNVRPHGIADMNGDGGVDSDDIIFFFDRWEVGDPTSDINQDGGVDGEDVIAFFGRWDAGC